MSATIRDVAKLAGVSASTVSRVINKSAPISGETTERIYRAMEELKYVPNDIARSFASGSARAIAKNNNSPTICWIAGARQYIGTDDQSILHRPRFHVLIGYA